MKQTGICIPGADEERALGVEEPPEAVLEPPELELTAPEPEAAPELEAAVLMGICSATQVKISPIIEL